MTIGHKSTTIRIGLDDTDHPESGCTTETLDKLLRLLTSTFDLTIQERRLVRLWPFAERRTRGNGALGALIASNESAVEPIIEKCREWFNELAEQVSHFPDSEFPTSPCLVISLGEAPEEWYWSSVRGHVDFSERLEAAIESGCEVFCSGTNWGIVGASAAVSWLPKSHSSWELVAWRDDSNIGKNRQVCYDSVSQLESLFPDTFLNRDPTKAKGLIAPRTPCPVLYGIRGSNPESVREAHLWLQSQTGVEKCKSFAIHITNQLSDDHIPSEMKGTVISQPTEMQGGHSHVSVFSEGRRQRLVAFSEGGPVNRLLRTTRPGDVISWKGLKSPQGDFHLEKMCIVDATPRILSRPICCSKTMRSAGKGQLLRCPKCGKMQEKLWLTIPPSHKENVTPGHWVEPHPSNRRHLASPLPMQ